MRRAAKVDGNHGEVMQALRKVGITAVSIAALKEICDVIAGFRGVNLLLEIKDGSLPPSARQLTAGEKTFHETWAGRVVVVNSPEEAVLAVIDYAKEMGRV